MSGFAVLTFVGTWVVLLAAVVSGRRLVVARALRGVKYTTPGVAMLDASEVPAAIRAVVQPAAVLVERGFAPLGTFRVEQAEGNATWYGVHTSSELATSAAYLAIEQAGAVVMVLLQFATDFDDGHEVVTIDGGAENPIILGTDRTVVDSRSDDPEAMLVCHLAAVAERCNAGHKPRIADAEGYRAQLDRELAAYFERQVASAELLPAGEGRWRLSMSAAWRDAEKVLTMIGRQQGRRRAWPAAAAQPVAGAASPWLYIAIVIASLVLIFATVRARSPDGALAPAAAPASARESSGTLAERLAVEYETAADDGPFPGADGSTVTLGLDRPLAAAFRDEADYMAFLAEINDAAGQVAAAHRGLVDLPAAGDAFEMGPRVQGTGYITVHLLPWARFVATSPPPDIRKRPLAHMQATAAALRTWAGGQAGGVPRATRGQAESIQLRVTRDGPATLNECQAALLAGIRRAVERHVVGVEPEEATYLVVVSDATYPFGP